MAKTPVVSHADELELTRLSLLERLSDLKDPSTWLEFFDSYWKLIYFAAAGAGLSDQDAQEVVRLTIIRMAPDLFTIRQQLCVSSFKQRLMQVTRNCIIDLLGKVVSSRSNIANTFEDLWHAEWEMNLLDAAIERVKRRIAPQHYQIFHLHSIKGLSTRHVARLFGISVLKVYTTRLRVARSIKKEVRALERRRCILASIAVLAQSVLFAKWSLGSTL